MAFESVGRDGERHASAEQAIGPYMRAILRHWILVVVVTLLAGLIAGVTAAGGGKTYQASSSILVSPLPEGQSSTLGIGTVVDTGDPARTIQTAAALIDTQQAAQAAAQTLGKGWTAGRVMSAVGVTPCGRQQRGGGDGFGASNPEDAARVANAFAQGAIAYRGSVVQKQVKAELATLDARLAQLPANSAEAQALRDDRVAAAQRSRDATVSRRCRCRSWRRRQADPRERPRG